MKTFFFFGDSLTLGVNDPEHLGWVGRLCTGAKLPVPPTTFYNLGARKHSSHSILKRWKTEVAARRLPESDVRLLFCFGTVDTVGADNATVLPAPISLQNFAALLSEVGEHHEPRRVRVLSPFPVAQEEHRRRIRELGGAYAEIAQGAGVDYVDIFPALAADPRYMGDLADGVHPGAAGCAAVSAALLRNESMKAWMHS